MDNTKIAEQTESETEQTEPDTTSAAETVQETAADDTVEQSSTVDTAAGEESASAAATPERVSTVAESAQPAAGSQASDVAASDAAQEAPAKSSGVLSGVAAVVAGGLALVSVNGTWLGTQLAERQQLAGQIKAQSGATANPIADVYGAPWHATAVVNGVFALVAVLVGAAVLLRSQLGAVPQTARWVKAVAGAALVLGAIGLVIAAVLWSDALTPLPAMPTRSAG